MSSLGKRGTRDKKPSQKKKEEQDRLKKQRLEKQAEQQRLKKQRLKKKQAEQQRLEKQRLEKQAEQQAEHPKTPTSDFYNADPNNITPSNPFDMSPPKKSTVSPSLFSSTPLPDFKNAKIERPADSYNPNSPYNMGSPPKYKKEDSEDSDDDIIISDSEDSDFDAGIGNIPEDMLDEGIGPSEPKTPQPRLRF